MKIIERLYEVQRLQTGPTANAPDTQSQIEALRKEVPEPILAHYDRLLARGKKGVALVRNTVCTGCMMKLASGIHAALLRDEDIAMCDTCARYLLLEPEPATAPPPAPPPPARKKAVRKVRRKSETPPAE